MSLLVSTAERSGNQLLKQQGEGLPLIAPVRKKMIKLLKNGLVALITFLLTLEQYKQKKNSSIYQCSGKELCFKLFTVEQNITSSAQSLTIFLTMHLTCMKHNKMTNRSSKQQRMTKTTSKLVSNCIHGENIKFTHKCTQKSTETIPFLFSTLGHLPSAQLFPHKLQNSYISFV